MVLPLHSRLLGGVANEEEFQCLLTGEFGEHYVIEVTTNIESGTVWTPIGTVTNPFGGGDETQI